MNILRKEQDAAGKWLLWVENDTGQVVVLKFGTNPTNKQALAVAADVETKRLAEVSLATNKVKIIADIDAKIAELNKGKALLEVDQQDNGVTN